MPFRELNMADLRLDGGTQPRASIDENTVTRYAHDLHNGDEFPPVVAFFDGTIYWLADGFHRYYAYLAELRTTIEADVRPGTLADAIMFAVGANHEHGLQRTRLDKIRCVLMLLSQPDWAGRADRWIAETARVSHPFVAAVRAAVADGRLELFPTGNVSSCPDVTPENREGKDGKSRPARPRKPAPAGDDDPDDSPPDEPEPRPVPAPPPEPRDAVGNVIPEALRPVFAEGWKFDRAIALCQELYELLDSIWKGPSAVNVHADGAISMIVYDIDKDRPWLVNGDTWTAKGDSNV